eukprot:g30972.t1
MFRGWLQRLCHDVVGVRVVLQLPHVRQVCMVLEAVNASHRTARRGSCCSCPVSSVPLGGGGSIVHAASAAKFAFGVEEVTSSRRVDIRCNASVSLLVLQSTQTGLASSSEVHVCIALVGRRMHSLKFGGIGGVSLIEVSSALVELNCRCRCSPMGVECR